MLRLNLILIQVIFGKENLFKNAGLLILQEKGK